MTEADRIPGSLIRRERLRRGMEQKTLCRGICVPSYLSKIEHGKVKAEAEILRALFRRLEIDCFADDRELEEARRLLESGYEKLCYHLPLQQELAALAADRSRLESSVLAPDLYILLGMRGENTLPALAAMANCLSPAQRAWLPFLRREWGEEVPLPELRFAAGVLGTSFAWNLYGFACYARSEYAEILHLEEPLTALALSEGNTYALAEYYSLKASAYSCLFLEDMMMRYYMRAIRLLQNTAWRDRCQTMYYNIGASLLRLKQYGEAEKYLALAEDEPDRFLLLHKRATLAIRRGDAAAGRALLADMEALLSDEPALRAEQELRLEELRWECREDYLAEPAYLRVLDRLIRLLERHRHAGHVSFYQDVYLAACTRQRQYKKALAYQQKISSVLIKNPL